MYLYDNLKTELERNKMIKITEEISIEEDLLVEEFIRSSGPGGQNVNKVNTAVLLRFNIKECNSIPEEVMQRLIKIAGRKIVWDKEKEIPLFLVIKANRFRTQEQNRKDALGRLKEIIIKSTFKPKKRYATKPSYSSIQKRIKKKKLNKKTKESRKKINFSDEDH